MKILAIIVPIMTACLVLAAYAPVIKLALDFNKEYRENFDRLKAGDTDALEESIREPLENFLPDDPKDVVKDSALDIIREIILKRVTGRSISQD